MRKLILSCLLTLAGISSAASQTLPAQQLPGYDSFDLKAAHRALRVAASIWYPTRNTTYWAPVGDDPIFEPTYAYIGAAVKEGKHSLVLLSHGSDGNADTLGWLSSALVSRGAIELAVNHPGSASGDSSPRRSADLKSRAQDLRAALDSFLVNPAFASFVDKQK